MELLTKYGAGALVGLIAGLAFASWINPSSNEGFGLLVLIFVVIGAGLSALWGAIRPKKDG